MEEGWRRRWLSALRQLCLAPACWQRRNAMRIRLIQKRFSPQARRTRFALRCSVTGGRTHLIEHYAVRLLSGGSWTRNVVQSSGQTSRSSARSPWGAIAYRCDDSEAFRQPGMLWATSNLWTSSLGKSWDWSRKSNPPLRSLARWLTERNVY